MHEVPLIHMISARSLQPMHWEEDPFAQPPVFERKPHYHGGNQGKPYTKKQNHGGAEEGQPFQKNHRKFNKQESDDEFEVVDNQKRVFTRAGAAPYKKGPYHHGGQPGQNNQESSSQQQPMTRPPVKAEAPTKPVDKTPPIDLQGWGKSDEPAKVLPVTEEKAKTTEPKEAPKKEEVKPVAPPTLEKKESGPSKKENPPAKQEAKKTEEQASAWGKFTESPKEENNIGQGWAAASAQPKKEEKPSWAFAVEEVKKEPSKPDEKPATA